MLVAQSRHEALAMSNVSGKTSNGFTYEADYQPASAGRVNWTATFRHDGDFAGMRHGCVHDMHGVLAAAVDDAVKVDIESTWTNAS
jgi:type VI protein secretion system component VasF